MRFVEVDQNLEHKEEEFYAIKNAHHGCKDRHTHEDRKSRMLPLTGVNNLQFAVQGLFIGCSAYLVSIQHATGRIVCFSRHKSRLQLPSSVSRNGNYPRLFGLFLLPTDS